MSYVTRMVRGGLGAVLRMAYTRTNGALHHCIQILAGVKKKKDVQHFQNKPPPSPIFVCVSVSALGTGLNTPVGAH